jgi:UDP-glucuronate decarboxylase
MTRILVTGGAGFIGSHLCRRLLAQGHTVICADNFRTSAAESIAELDDDPAFSFLHHDVTQPLHVEAEQIYNLACPASPIHYQNDPVATLKTSVLGTLNVLELARATGARVLQASTSEVYGDPQIHPQHEGYWGHVNPIGPRACYDEGKRAAETLMCDYHRQHGSEIRIARIFNTYGPRMHWDDGRVVSNFIIQALHDEAITIGGDGSQSRSFCYVSDLVEGLIALMNVTGPDADRPVNLGNTHEVSIRDLALRIIALTGSASVLESIPLPTDDPRQRQPDIARAEALLGWSPRVTLEEGLKATIVDFRARKVLRDA